MTLIVLPLSEEQAQACASAAQAMGVESWEIAVHILGGIQRADLLASADKGASDG